MNKTDSEQKASRILDRKLFGEDTFSEIDDSPAEELSPDRHDESDLSAESSDPQEERPIATHEAGLSVHADAKQEPSPMREANQEQDPLEPDNPPQNPQKSKPGRFDWMEEYHFVRSRMGVPEFNPPMPPHRLFNLPAALFGPLYYIIMAPWAGMWRKILPVCLIWILCHIPTILSEMWIVNEKSLIRDFQKTYEPHYAFIVLLTIFAALLFCKGRWILCALSVVLSAGVIYTGYDRFADQLIPMDRLDSFLWLCSIPIFEAILSVTFFLIFIRNQLSVPFGIICAVFFFYTGLPMDLLFTSIPGAALSILFGLMASWDNYRGRVLHQKFWW
ncbi:MAG: hypothetical protein PUB69_02675 [Desulfovibrionaceae bacterium]|nr:hypothetical protein [Desulfovibrionaceae bacterium]